ncbi:MAG: ATP-binding protein [Acidimicrobiales bacterium]
MPSAQADFPAEPAGVGDARRFVRAALGDWGADEWEWAASQLVTELATNAVIHARSPFRVEVALSTTGLRICVTDGSARQPLLRAHGVRATTGRGLTLVDSLSESWGFTVEGAGKQVWVQLGARSASRSDGTERSGAAAGAPAPARAGVAPPTSGRPHGSGGLGLTGTGAALMA